MDTAGEKKKRTSKKNVDGRSTSSHDNKKFCKDTTVTTQLYYQVHIPYRLHVSANVAVAIIRLDTIYQRSYIDMI